ncbi:hypothetical protein D9757_006454 [Collybiopsis confluens]|uniref:Uncharacterized protein n=1 Tax=Collybiopsis confluens TaxID=2823264 RepID=A0A8H5M7V8_9AGAR|nr:hypothetical protein D9757_006454 [Collybiopsis confluens]
MVTSSSAFDINPVRSYSSTMSTPSTAHSSRVSLQPSDPNCRPDCTTGSANILSPTTTMKCMGRTRRRESARSTARDEERRKSLDGFSWNPRNWTLPSSSIARVDTKPGQSSNYAASFAAHAPQPFSPEPGPSTYRPRNYPLQSIPSDVGNHPRSFLSTSDDGDDTGKIQVVKKDYRSGAKQQKNVASVTIKDVTLSKIHAIDPASFRSLVEFDYSCLDNLDDELILRPRSAFEEVCWSTAVQNTRRSNRVSNGAARPSSSSSSRAATPVPVDHHIHEMSSHAAKRVSLPHRLPTPPLSYYTPSVKSVRGSPKVDVFAVGDNDTVSDLVTETEGDRSTLLSSEPAALMMVTGRKRLTVIGGVHSDSEVMNYKRKPSVESAEEVFVPSGPVTSRHGTLEKLHANISRPRNIEYYQVGLDKQDDLEADADVRSFISFDEKENRGDANDYDDDDDDNETPIFTPMQSTIHTPLDSPIHTPLASPILAPLASPINKHIPVTSPIPQSLFHSPRHPQSLPALRNYAYSHGDQILYSNLQHAFANPHESVGYYPIPPSSAVAAAKTKDTIEKPGRTPKRLSSVKRNNGYVGNLGASVAKFCQAAFPLSGRADKAVAG